MLLWGFVGVVCIGLLFVRYILFTGLMCLVIVFLLVLVRVNVVVENVRVVNSMFKSDWDIFINLFYILKVSVVYLLFLECFNLMGGNCC